MPPEKQTESVVPIAAPIDVAPDPQVTADHLAKAAKVLEYDTAEPKPKETPEEIAEAELAETPKPKQTKKTQPAAKVEPEPITDTPKEPVKSKRELFKEKADAEAAYRSKEAKLKEREQAAQAVEERYKDIIADPVAYLEKNDPKFFERMVDRYSANGDTKNESSEAAALRAEVEKIREELKGTTETLTKKEQYAEYDRQLNEGERILSSEDFADVIKVAGQYEAFTGRKTDLRKELARVWIDFKNQYEKELTPLECCEILLEDAQAHLERVSASQAQPPAEIKTKKQPPPTGTTLTQQQETLSEPAPEKNYSQYKKREDLIRAVANRELEYKVEE